MMRGSDLTVRIGACAAVLLAASMISTLAQAQTMSANSASFNAGYGRYSDQENQPVNVSMADANGNVTIVNGVATSAQAGSVFAGAGAFDNFSGAGSSGSASAIGNNLNVVTEGNNNTVIVTSVQSNSGNVSATTNGNGN
jgi:holdfast attachment protein HfaA